VAHSYRAGQMRFLSGHVLYYLSGFLSIQLDIQSFLAQRGYGGSVIATNVFKTMNISDLSPTAATEAVARAIIFSKTSDELYSRLSDQDDMVCLYVVS
jgi:hypothetical protein